MPRYTVPAITPGQNKSILDNHDETILATLTPRKELRKTSGLVRLQTGDIDSRPVDLEGEWVTESNVDSGGESSEEDEEAPEEEYLPDCRGE